MKSFRAVLSLFVVAFLITAPALAATTTHHSSAHHSKSKAKPAKSHKMHGQQAIDSERVTQIQQALIREHYLTGEASGQWDSTTQAAMQKFQSDQGWQTRLMPDYRALVKLGLGPDYSTAINAKDVASAAPPAPSNSIPAPQSAGFAAAAGVNK
jgi:peptidoglycan hydrolase-like protein with peptidoglycan-binding domain